MFIGYVTLGSSMAGGVLFRDSSRTPSNTDALPTFRVYGDAGLVTAVTGTASLLDTGTITAASNATPIVVTSTAHGLTTGVLVTVTGVGGNTAANGTRTITRLTADTYSLDGSVGNSAYTSGGTWNVTGLYRYAFTASAANGFDSGETYLVLVTGKIAGVGTAETQTFVAA